MQHAAGPTICGSNHQALLVRCVSPGLSAGCPTRQGSGPGTATATWPFRGAGAGPSVTPESHSCSHAGGAAESWGRVTMLHTSPSTAPPWTLPPKMTSLETPCWDTTSPAWALRGRGHPAQPAGSIGGGGVHPGVVKQARHRLCPSLQGPRQLHIATACDKGTCILLPAS